MKKLVMFLGLAAATLVAMTGCETNASPKSIVDLVPADTAVLGSVKLGQVAQDAAIRDLVGRIAQTQGAAAGPTDSVITQVTEKIGVNLADVREVVFAVPSKSLANAGKAPTETHSPRSFNGVVFLNGTYQKDKVVAALERQNKGPLAKSTYKGQEILVAAGQNDAEIGAIVFLQPDLVILGRESAVKSVVDVQNGDAPAISGAVLQGYQELGSPLAKVYAKIPEGMLSSAQGNGQNPSPLALDPMLFSKVGSTSLTIDKAGDRLQSQVTLVYPDAPSAQKTRDTLAGLVSLLKGMIADPATNKALSSLEVKNAGSQVTLTASLSGEDINALTQIFAIASRTQGQTTTR